MKLGGLGPRSQGLSHSRPGEYHSRPRVLFVSHSRRGFHTRNEGPFVSRAKSPPTKIKEKGSGNENGTIQGWKTRGPENEIYTVLNWFSLYSEIGNEFVFLSSCGNASESGRTWNAVSAWNNYWFTCLFLKSIHPFYQKFTILEVYI